MKCNTALLSICITTCNKIFGLFTSIYSTLRFSVPKKDMKTLTNYTSNHIILTCGPYPCMCEIGRLARVTNL